MESTVPPIFPRQKNSQLAGLRFFFSTEVKKKSGIPEKSGGGPSLIIDYFTYRLMSWENVKACGVSYSREAIILFQLFPLFIVFFCHVSYSLFFAISSFSSFFKKILKFGLIKKVSSSSESLID